MKHNDRRPSAASIWAFAWYCTFCLSLLAQTSAALAAPPGASPELRSIKLGGQRKLRVNLISEPRCSFSDTDAISSELEHTYWIATKTKAADPRTDVYLTIEPVSGDSNRQPFQPVAKCLSCNDLNPKTGALYTIPKVNEPVLAGIFVCTASTKTDSDQPSCANKEVASFSKIFRKYSVEVSPQTGKGRLSLDRVQPTDKVFFFRHVIVDQDAVYFSEQGMTRESYEALGKLLQTPDKDRDIAALRKYGGLASAPLKGDGGGIVVNLPHYRPSKCGH